MRKQLSRYYHTLRYYRPSQVFYRLLARAKHLRAPARIRRLCQEKGLRARTFLPGIAEPIADGPRLFLERNGVTLRLLNRFYEGPLEFRWQELEKRIPTRLGRFHLHYHEFFLPKYSGDDWPAPPAQIWQWITQWIGESSLPSSAHRPDAWHPYVISRRIPVWVKLFSLHPPDEPIAGQVLNSLTAQARWLAKNLEFDLGGNHLVQNLRALAVAGAFFEGSEADGWLDTVRALLPSECTEQILPSGEHFERSPMYHVDVLLALADIQDAFQAGLGESPDYLDDVIARIAGFLGRILHPDGQISLFGDSALDLTPPPHELFARLKVGPPNLQPEHAVSCQVGDYWVYREGSNFLIFDAGPVGPDYLPAHAHADLLTLEASWGGKRLFVDAGVYDYEDSPERAYCRSTAAHNTLEIDGQNQCDVWSRFRMGRRGWPGILHRDSIGPFHYAWCTHNAYRHLGCPEVRRLIMCMQNGPWLVVDWVLGRGEVQSASRLHISDEWKLGTVSESAITLDSPPDRLVIEPGSAFGHTWRQGAANCFPEFGSKRPVHVLTLESKGSNVFVWQIRSQDAAPAGCVVGYKMASFTYRGHECIVFTEKS